MSEWMRIIHLGHAGLRVDGVDLRLLMDPWLSERGAFQAAWHQFPSNAHYEQSRSSDEKIVVNAPDGRYEIARYCPHAGEDLANGSAVRAGMIRCLGHNPEFDLPTGVCLNARCEPFGHPAPSRDSRHHDSVFTTPGGSDVVRTQ